MNVLGCPAGVVGISLEEERKGKRYRPDVKVERRE